MKQLLFVLVMLLSAAFPVSAQDSSSARMVILEAETQEDAVQVRAIIQGADSWRYASLNAESFQVSEPNAGLSVSGERSAGLTLGVVVNLSFGSDLVEIQNTLRAYFNSYFRSGDQAIFTLVNTSQPQIVTARSMADALVIIDSMTLSAGYESFTAPLADTLELLQDARVEAPERAVIGLFVSSFLNQASDVDAATAWGTADIALHVVQAHRFRDDWTDEFRDLATAGRGIFVNNKAGVYFQAGPPVIAVSSLRAQYDAIDAARTVYTITYRPRRADLTTNPVVTLSAQITPQTTLQADFRYERRFSAPEIALVGLAQGPERRPRREAGAVIFDLDSLPLRAEVSFPDGVARRLTGLAFEVALQNADGTAGEVVQSSTLDAPEADAFGQFALSWDLSSFNTPGFIQPVLITVTVRDDLGLTGTVQVASQVTVAALPPLPTPTATFTPSPTATHTPTITPTPTETLTPTAVPVLALGSNPLTGDPTLLNLVRGPDTTIRWLIGVIGALVLLAALLVLRLNRANRRTKEAVVMAREYAIAPPPPTEEGSAPSAAAASLKSEESEPQHELTEEELKVVGRLVVVNGYQEPEIVLDRTEFVIGRSAEAGNHLVIDQPFISPRHCVISYRSGRFLIRDLGSKNGTFLNGERIPTDRDVIAPIGSEVGITRNISTELWDPFTVVEIRRDNRSTQETHGTRHTSGGRMTTTGYSSFGTNDDDPISDDYSPI